MQTPGKAQDHVVAGFFSCLIVVAILSPLAADASQDDALMIFAMQDLTWEDNLFRVADGARPVIDGVRRPRGDRLSVTRLGVQFDRSYSRQQLTAELALSQSDYLEFDHLDFTAHNFRAGWQWALGNQWNGLFSAEQSERLRSFSDRIGTVGSINTHRRYRVDARYLMHPEWSVGAGWTRTDSRFDDRESARSEYIEDGLEGLLQYRSLAGSTLALVVRTTDGRYPERNEAAMSITRYTQRDLLLRADWAVSGHSRLTGHAGYTARQYPQSGDKDFNGFTGRLTFDWRPSGKVAIGVTGRREMGAREDVADNFVVTRAVSIDPMWGLTSKVRVRGRLEWLRRDYGGDPFGIAAPDRDDRTQARGIALEWSPIRNLALQLGARKERRSSSDAAHGYRASSLFISAQCTF